VKIDEWREGHRCLAIAALSRSPLTCRSSICPKRRWLH